MDAEVWRFVALILFFAVVLIASYWFVLLPERWMRQRGRVSKDEDEPVKEQAERVADP